MIIELLPQRLDDIRKITNLFDASAYIQGGMMSTTTRRIYQEFRQQANGFELIIEGLILEMLGQTSRQNNLKDFSPLPRWLKQAQELIHQHFAEKLSLYSIADAIEIHPSHLARKIRTFGIC